MPPGGLVLTPPVPLVLGGDLGGTSTRIAIADHTGRILGRGTAGGGNPTSHPASAAAALREALVAAVAGLDASTVRAAVIGVAGGGALVRPEVRADFDAAWAATGIGVQPRYISDLEVAFAAGTPDPDGTILIAGTGAAAGALTDHQVLRTADAHGWLLGDDGGGFWLGREAVRATLHALDRREPPGALGRRVIDALGGVPEPTSAKPAFGGSRDTLRDAIIERVNQRPPVLLAGLAPAVAAAYDDQDPAAADIVERAAGLLTNTVSRIRSATEDGPLVLAGSVAGESSPIGRALRRSIAGRFAGPLRPARDGAGGAAWLALRDVDPALATPEAHAHLVTPAT